MRTTFSAITRRWGLAVVFTGLLAMLTLTTVAQGAEENTGGDWMGVVNANPGKIMDGNNVLKEVPQGTRLWVFSEKPSWAEVKVPGGDQHGWILLESLNSIFDGTQETQNVIDDVNKQLEVGDTLFNEKKYAEALELQTKLLEKVKQYYGDDNPLVGDVYRNVANVQENLNDFSAAKTNYKLALANYSAVYGKTHLNTVFALQNLGAVHRLAKEFPEAKKLLQEALATMRLQHAEQIDAIAGVLLDVGNVAFDEKNDAEAKRCYNEAMTIWKKDLDKNFSSVINTLKNLGNLQLRRKDDAAADKLYEEALALANKYYGEKHDETVNVIYALAQAAYERRELKLARKYAEKALAITRETKGNEHADTADALDLVGGMIGEQSDFRTSRQYLEESLKIKQKLLKPDHPDIAKSYYGLGCLAAKQGDYSSSKKYHTDALAISQSANDQFGVATNISMLAGISLSLGDFPQARKHAEEELAIWRKMEGEHDQNIADSLQLLGSIAESQGDYAVAEKHFTDALALRRKVLRPFDSLIANSLCDLGSIALERKDLRLARQHLEEGLKILRQNTDEDDSLIYQLTYLGALETESHNYQAAKKYYAEALEKTIQIYGNDSDMVASVFKKIGELAVETKDYAGAWKHYEEALAIERRFYGKEHPNTIDAQQLLALLAISEEDYDSAQRRIDEVRRITRRYVQYVLPSLSAQEQLKFLDGNYHEFWQQCLSFARLSNSDTSIANTSAAWLVNGKAIAHEALAERELLARDLANPQLAPLVRELQDVRAQMASLALSAPKPSEAEVHQNNLTKLGATEFRLAQKLAEANGREAIVRDWIELESVRRTIPAGGVYLDLISVPVYDFVAKKAGSPRYLVWVIPAHRNGKVQLIDLGEAPAIDNAIQQLLTTMADAGKKNGMLKTEGETAATARVTKDLQVVSDLVLKPLLPHLADKKQLILSPDGALWLLPWAALPVAENKSLLEQCSIRFILSGRDLIKRDGTSKLSTNAPAIFADPDFNLAGQAAKTAIKALLPLTTFNNTATLGVASNSSLPQVTLLPFTALEGDAAKPLMAKLAGNAPQSFQQGQALEAVVKSLKRPKQVLFATHGFFLPDQEVKQRDEKLQLASNDTRSLPPLTTDNKPVENPLLRCGLLLAGCNAPRTAGLDDGILTGLEIVGMDLRGTELVVLSACETGIGRVHNGEGVAGLRQAFQLAGAQSVVSTLWQVPDRDSAIIMQDFFTNLAAGQSKADALRNAQLKRITARKEKSGAAHPFFWAAWTVTGE